MGTVDTRIITPGIDDLNFDSGNEFTFNDWYERFLSTYEILPPDQIDTHIRIIKLHGLKSECGNESALALLRCYQKLLIGIVHRFVRSNIEVEDLMQTANEEMLRLVEEYDSTRGSFANFIAQYIPFKLHSVLHEKYAELDSTAFSLDEPLPGIEYYTYADEMPDTSQYGRPEIVTLLQLTREEVRNELNAIDPKVASVLCLRYGIQCNFPMMDSEIAHELQISTREVKKRYEIGIRLLRARIKYRKFT